jgi:hypothetical protein
MNTKFTILIAAGLLFAGVSQAQGTATTDFSKPHHEMMARHEMKKGGDHKMNRHHKTKHHHHKKMHHGTPGRH